ncbi:ATPase, V1 complex, subunit H [Gorgonomyces haynaldii]|nr:ATPase, V1 complex, subunit H [Gorgonomyces haynaldii]
MAEPDVDISTPVIASHNDYLEQTTLKLQSQSIPWEGYQRASLITEQELQEIRNFEANAEARTRKEYLDLLLTLLSKLSRIDTLQGILVLLDQYLSASVDRVSVFEQTEIGYGIFLKLLKKEDEYVQLKSAKILVYLIKEQSSSQQHDLQELFQWIIFQFSSTNESIVDIAIQYLANVLSVDVYRPKYAEYPNAIGSLVELIKKPNVSAQMQYQAIYCLWMLSYVPEACAQFASVHPVIPILKELAKLAIKEKVVRVIIATFKNMITKAPKLTIIPMLGNKLFPVIEQLSVRKWSDSDIVEDLQFIRDELSHHVAELTTFDEYESEVRSGKLEWSPPHLSEQFWKTNATRLSENGNELIKRLVDILTNPKAEVDLAIACHDLGQYVKYTTNGKNVIQETGAKTRVMALITHDDPDVRYQALSAVQKFMTNAW